VGNEQRFQRLNAEFQPDIRKKDRGGVLGNYYLAQKRALKTIHAEFKSTQKETNTKQSKQSTGRRRERGGGGLGGFEVYDRYKKGKERIGEKVPLTIGGNSGIGEVKMKSKSEI